jgi:hypothetical protein
MAKSVMADRSRRRTVVARVTSGGPSPSGTLLPEPELDLSGLDRKARRVLGPGRDMGGSSPCSLSLRVAPLRAFDPPSAPSDPGRRSAPRNGPFCLTKEC